MRNFSRAGFTLVELMVVIMIVSIFATLGVQSLRGMNKYYRQKQAALKVSSAIKAVQAFATQAEYDTANMNYWTADYPTRNGASIYFFQGWPNFDAAGTARADGTVDDGLEVSYSILQVMDSGYETNNRMKSPDTGPITGPAIAGLTSITDPKVRSDIIELPEGIKILFAGNADTEAASSGVAMGAVNYISYDTAGRLITTLGPSGVEDARYSQEFRSKSCYIAFVVASSGVVDDSIPPIYLDLRTGDIVVNTENIGTLDFGDFAGT